MPTREIVDEGFGTVVRTGEKIKALAGKIKSLLADPQLDEANAWVDMVCANCENSYRYNVSTGKTCP